MNHSEIASFIWGVADLVRDTFKRGKYQDVILPLTVLRRLDSVLAPTKRKVLAVQAKYRGRMALLHGPEQIADLPVPVAESPGAVRIGHPERSHLVEYLAPNSVFNSLPRQRSSPHLRPR